MATPKFTKNIQPSLLDRLIDEEPGSRVEAAMSRAESVRIFRAAVKRDLEWLLNTTCAPHDIPESCAETRRSVLCYGLPDVSSVQLQDPGDEQNLLRSLEEAIEWYEPRLAHARVTSKDPYRPGKQAITFHVEAVLLLDPAPERISFDTVLEISKGAYSVKEA
ncbi:MAG: type VI secretion system baseplate subunit TssE [Acidobacteriota bacterium]|nr:type VI secretion system baseplate subunit TssE [Acidobacteriota bacterium]